jgi:hypothetical protein
MAIRTVFVLSLTLSASIAAAQSPRALLIEARNLAYDANYRNDQAGLRSAVEVMEPLTQGAHAAYAHYYLSWTYGALFASQFQAQDMTAALASANRSLDYIRAGLKARPNDAEFHTQLAGAILSVMFADRSQFEPLYPQLKAAREKAVELGPTNPRAVMFEAGSMFNDPAYGKDGQTRGLARWEVALKLFEAEANERAVDPILPRWGYATAQGMLAGLYLRTTPPQKEAGRRAAAIALKMRPDFWYVREVLLPQLRD